MPADRFYIDADLKSGSSVLLEGPEHHHLVRVMRIGVGEVVELINGRGDLARGKVSEETKKNAVVEIFESRHVDEASFQFFLAVPLMRPSKLEWIVEKGTELGASAFFFFRADYSEKEDLSSHQLERLHALKLAALKQSGRLYAPAIEIVPDLAGLFRKEARFFFGDIRAKKPFGAQVSPVAFITGPERGFSQTETSLLNAHAEGILLSPYILRAETAPIAAASLLGVHLII